MELFSGHSYITCHYIMEPWRRGRQSLLVLLSFLKVGLWKAVFGVQLLTLNYSIYRCPGKYCRWHYYCSNWKVSQSHLVWLGSSHSRNGPSYPPQSRFVHPNMDISQPSVWNRHRCVFLSNAHSDAGSIFELRHGSCGHEVCILPCSVTNTRYCYL